MTFQQNIQYTKTYKFSMSQYKAHKKIFGISKVLSFCVIKFEVLQGACGLYNTTEKYVASKFPKIFLLCTTMGFKFNIITLLATDVAIMRIVISIENLCTDLCIAIVNQESS